MITFTCISQLLGESKFIGFFLPIFIYIVIKYLYGQYSLKSNRQHTRQLEDVTESIETDSIDNNADDNDDDDQLRPHLPEREHIPYGGLTEWLDTSGKRFYAIANNRRSIRKFASNKSVDIDVIENCIRAAGTSPSGAHTEPWTFCIIQDGQIKQEIREIIEAEEYTNYTQRMSKQWTTDLRPLKTDFVKEYLTDAPYLIIVFKQAYSIREDGTKQQHYYNEISTSIATGILITALQCAGLNSLVTTPLNCGPALRTLLNRPSNEKLVVLLPVGYAADDCLIPDLQRKPLDDILVKY